jgi:hypothetical protein
MKTFNFYCDESCHLENDSMPHMILGYLSVPYNMKDLHLEQIKEIKQKHKFYGEIKWSKVSNSQHKFYNDIVDYFFSSNLAFRAIVIPKAAIQNSAFNQDFDTFYYKMYYYLLNHRIDMRYTYNIYLDIKDALSGKKVQKLKEILQTKYGVVRNLQNIHSRESLFLQIADLLIGALNYNLRGELRVNAKVNLINKIRSHSNQPLTQSTFYNEEKMNLFFIELKQINAI